MMPSIQEYVSLKEFNTFGIDAKARYFSSFHNFDELSALLSKQKASDLPLFILGGGSNVLLTSVEIEAFVLKNELKGYEFVSNGRDEVILSAMAGENWHGLVMAAVNAGFGGIENMALIPGNIGAAPMQNIGAYGIELADVFHSLEAFDLQSEEMVTLKGDECDFGYRHSIFKTVAKGRFIITKVNLRLTKNHKLHLDYGAIRDTLAERGITSPSIKDVAEAVIAIRSSKLPDPKIVGNAGSFFKNPELPEAKVAALAAEFETIPVYNSEKPGMKKIPAAWLIERCGWKGKRFEHYGVHDKQALVLVNYGGANGFEIKQLAINIIESVKERFNIALSPEVNFVPEIL